MKTKTANCFSALIAIQLVLASLVAVPSAAQRGESRGLSVQIKAEGGKVINLYDESHALVIGISDYTGGWRSLPGVKRDVEEVAKTLKSHGFSVQVMLNLTSQNFDQTLRRFISQYGQAENNRLLIYFAGHGHTLTTVDGRELGYIVPADAPSPTRNPAGFKQAAVSMSEIEVYAQQIESKHALFVFDSCFSGALFEATRSIPPAIASRTALPVRQFITAGAGDQEVPDRSVFREQFVEALNGEADSNGDGYVTGSELGVFLEDRVTNYSNRAQTPRWGKIRNPKLDKGDFVFALAGASSQPRVVREPPPPAPARAGPDDARDFLNKFLKPNADYAALSAALRPDGADYRAVFTEPFATQAEAFYGPVWDSGGIVVAPQPQHVAVLIFNVRSEDIIAWNQNASYNHPGGWQRVGPHLKPGLTVYSFKFVERGASLGLAYTGLIHVNGRWRIFPKPWRALEK